MDAPGRADRRQRIRGPVVVTGTDTGVGKTIVTAAIAAAATAGTGVDTGADTADTADADAGAAAGGGAGAGTRVAVVKPAQTGMAPPEVDDGSVPAAPRPESDVETVIRLAAPATALTLATYPHPLAPSAAARESGVPPLPLAEVVRTVHELAVDHDLVIVEGAGGLLVPMGVGEHGDWTIADLAVDVAAAVVVVARAGLGTLNHTALTLEALARRGVDAYVVIGEWPAEPELVHRTNLVDLPGELGGVIPERAGTLAPASFRAAAPTWLAPALYGRFDPARFRQSGLSRP